MEKKGDRGRARTTSWFQGKTPKATAANQKTASARRGSSHPADPEANCSTAMNPRNMASGSESRNVRLTPPDRKLWAVKPAIAVMSRAGPWSHKAATAAPNAATATKVLAVPMVIGPAFLNYPDKDFSTSTR